jgi:RNA methyltransferase, TrmH family
MIKTITSPENPLIKRVVQLQSSKYRDKHQEFIAEGFRTISTLIAAGSKLITLFTTEEFLYDAQQITDYQHILIVSDAILKKISCAVTPSGLVATFAIPAQPSFDMLSSGIVLAQISDPGNMGTLIRTAAAMNKKTVVCIETVDPFNPKVVQATAGALGNIALFRMNWTDLLLNKKNLHLCALVASEGKNPDTVNLKDALIVVGNEGAGIPDAWIKQCDEKITLPMPGIGESLNAAVAGSIALYLAANQ